MERVLARIPDYQLAGEVTIGSNVAFNRGPLTIPVRFTPGPVSRAAATVG